MLLSDLRRDYLLTRIIELGDASTAAAQLNDAFKSLEEQSLRQFATESIGPKRVHFLRYGRCRYQNQEHSVEIDLPSGNATAATVEAIREHFHASYEREYTYRLTAPVELVCFHLVALAEVDKLSPQKRVATNTRVEEAIKGQRGVDYAEVGEHKATIYDGDLLGPGMSFLGPAIIEEAGTTVVIPPGTHCRVDDYGNYRLGKEAP
jgi:N-methylhydantoinase A